MTPVFLMAVWAFAGFSAAAVCLEKAVELPEGWKMLDELPDSSTPMRFSIALQQPHMDALPSKIFSGNHLSKAEADALRQPDGKHVEQVVKWLSENAITETQLDEDWVHATATVGTVDKLLDTKLRRYSFEGGKPIIRTTEYHVPDELTAAIDFIHPIVNFMTPEHQVSRAPPLPKHQARDIQRQEYLPCTETVDPECIMRLYALNNYSTPDGKSQVRFGIAGFLEQWASYADLHQSFQRWRPDLVKAGYNFTVESINGGENRQGPGLAGAEANLDIQYGMAVGYPTNVIYYSTGGRGVKLDDNGKPLTGAFNDNEPYMEFFRHMAKKQDYELPHVLSLSYADDEYSVPKRYAFRVCNEIGLLASRGVSVLSGSGDGGARGARDATCRSHDGLNRDMAIVSFPASCPWVTAVGAVNNGFNPPHGADFSGGGFSSLFPRPKWQKYVTVYYVQKLKWRLYGKYSLHMRAVPDISVVGTQFNTIVNGENVLLQGTSASTPVMAAMIALVNDARLRKGRKVLGWLNAKITNKLVIAVLQDPILGQSKSCVFSGGRMPGGWPVTKEWDAVTGMGVPYSFPKFLRVFIES